MSDTMDLLDWREKRVIRVTYIDGLPPAQLHSATSVMAAQEIRPSVKTLQTRVLNFIKSMGDHGATDEEIAEGLRMPGNTERPRRRELEIAGLICKADFTRKTSSGRSAVVWIASQREGVGA